MRDQNIPSSDAQCIVFLKGDLSEKFNDRHLLDELEVKTRNEGVNQVCEGFSPRHPWLPAPIGRRWQRQWDCRLWIHSH